jgi:hypothetical protein
MGSSGTALLALAAVLAACVQTASADCICTGTNVGFPPNQLSPFDNATLFPADYGQTYKAWDAVVRPGSRSRAPKYCCPNALPARYGSRHERTQSVTPPARQPLFSRALFRKK